MKWSQFRKDLECGSVRFFSGHEQTPIFLPPKHWARRHLVDLIACSERYVFDAPIYPDIELYRSLEAMYEADVFRLPAPVVLFEVAVDQRIILAICIQGEGEIKVHAALTVERARAPFAITPFVGRIRQNPWRVKESKTIGKPSIIPAIDVSPEVSKEEVHQSFLLDFERDGALIDRLTADRSAMALGIDLTKACISMVPAFLVALATRGVKLQRMNYAPSGRVESARGLPITAHTVVHVRNSAGASVVTDSELGQVRSRIRLHLRAGHVRNQPFGPGRSQVRKIWIAPCLVGYEEAGVVLHTEHRVTA